MLPLNTEAKTAVRRQLFGGFSERVDARGREFSVRKLPDPRKAGVAQQRANFHEVMYSCLIRDIQHVCMITKHRAMRF